MDKRTIYFGDGALHIFSKDSSFENRWPVIERDNFSLDALLERFSHHKELAVECTSDFSPLDELLGCMKPVTAAGGAVRSESGRVLLIRRFHRWDLPKGRTESGETPRRTALREVEEETGLHSLEIVRELHQTFHAYDTYGEWELKRTFWFEMTGRESETLKVQSSEDIEQARWVDAKSLDDYMDDAFPLIRDVIGKIVW